MAVQTQEASALATRAPDFLVVGHQKCGTTALHLLLKSHPQIFMPEVKEPRFFASDMRSRFGAKATVGRPLTLDGYLALFAAARADQRIGEASPQYLRSSVAAANIAQVQPAARIIAILREPASFLRSFHMQMVSSNVESQSDFRKALALEPARRKGKRVPRRCHQPGALLYSEHVRYVEQLGRYYDRFPAENVLVLIYDDFRADNDATVRRVLRFLDVDDSVALETVQTKPLRAVRSVPLHQLADAARMARWNPQGGRRLGRAVNALTPGPLRSDAFKAFWRRTVYRAPDPPDQALMLELRARFKGEVVALSEFIRRDLVAEWGYENIG
jgi:Sulfotransferase domain